MSEGIKAAKLCWKLKERNVELTEKLGHKGRRTSFTAMQCFTFCRYT